MGFVECGNTRIHSGPLDAFYDEEVLGTRFKTLIRTPGRKIVRGSFHQCLYYTLRVEMYERLRSRPKPYLIDLSPTVHLRLQERPLCDVDSESTTPETTGLGREGSGPRHEESELKVRGPYAQKRTCSRTDGVTLSKLTGSEVEIGRRVGGRFRVQVEKSGGGLGQESITGGCKRSSWRETPFDLTSHTKEVRRAGRTGRTEEEGGDRRQSV